VLTIFKPKKGKTKVVKLTPKIANKIAKNAKVEKTKLEDCLKDIELRAKRGYTWTYMLQVEVDTIVELENEGWKVKRVGFNPENNTHMIKINW
jgi:hypothetical protein